ERARARERVHRPATEHLVRLDVGEVLTRDIHEHKRIKIDVRLLRDALGFFVRQSDCGHRRLLRTRRERPRYCRAAGEGDELASPHSITSSANPAPSARSSRGLRALHTRARYRLRE